MVMSPTGHTFTQMPQPVQPSSTRMLLSIRGISALNPNGEFSGSLACSLRAEMQAFLITA